MAKQEFPPGSSHSQPLSSHGPRMPLTSGFFHPWTLGPELSDLWGPFRFSDSHLMLSCWLRWDQEQGQLGLSFARRPALKPGRRGGCGWPGCLRSIPALLVSWTLIPWDGLSVIGVKDEPKARSLRLHCALDGGDDPIQWAALSQSCLPSLVALLGGDAVEAVAWGEGTSQPSNLSQDLWPVGHSVRSALALTPTGLTAASINMGKRTLSLSFSVHQVL